MVENDFIRFLFSCSCSFVHGESLHFGNSIRRTQVEYHFLGVNLSKKESNNERRRAREWKRENKRKKAQINESSVKRNAAAVLAQVWHEKKVVSCGLAMFMMLYLHSPNSVELHAVSASLSVPLDSQLWGLGVRFVSWSPEYFVCILFSCMQRLPYENKMHSKSAKQVRESTAVSVSTGQRK